MLNRYALLLLLILFVGCQSKLEMIGGEHAKEVEKWQALANYAGNELKHLGLTVTAGVQINQETDQTSYSLVKVQLNRNANHQEIDLLSPKFAEKFACGINCERLGLYDSSFATQKTQLANFFYKEEGRFFEFYGRLTRLNNILADYRASSPDVLKKYLTLMLNRKLVFNSLDDFINNLEMYVNEEKLIAFASSGFISPEENRLNSRFIDDVIVSLPKDWNIGQDEVFTSDNWQDIDANEPDKSWNVDSLTGDELLFASITDGLETEVFTRLPSISDSKENFAQANNKRIEIGTLVCSFSDSRLGIVMRFDANQVTLKVIAQARIVVDGLKLYPQPGSLFSAEDSYYFVKGQNNETYPLADIAPCNIERLKRAQKSESSTDSLVKLSNLSTQL